MAPQAKKKLRYSLGGAVSNPVPHGTLVVQPWFFFFFFFFFFFYDENTFFFENFQTSVAPQQNFIR